MKTLLLFISILISATFLSCNARKSNSNCNSQDIEEVDKCLIGKPLEECMRILNITSKDFIPHRIFYREVHGIYIKANGCRITLIVESPYIMSDAEAEGAFRDFYKYILQRKVKGVCWFKGEKSNSVGDLTYAGCMSM